MELKFGEIVLLNRRRLGLSQTALAKSASISRTYLSQIENGNEHVTLVVVKRLFEALGIRGRVAIMPRDDELEE